MLKKLICVVATGLTLSVIGTTVVRAGVLDDVKKKGVLVVGTKADYRPFGYLDPSGKIVGLEADLAADVAKRLGVKLELVPVVASNRIQFLQQGKIDLMIATTSDTPDRRKIVDGSCKVLIHNNIIEFAAVPHFFPGGIQAARDDFRRVLAALFQPFLERRK